MENKPMAQPNDPSRRKFLKGALAGMVLGAGAGLVGNELARGTKELNRLFETFNGMEGDFMHVVKASNMLMAEMDLQNINTVKLSGTSHPNARIDFLRTFLTKHLTSEAGKVYSFRDQLLQSGVYTRESLNAIGGAALYIINNSPSPIPQVPQEPTKTSGKKIIL
jgi:hypothetical protein